MLTVWSVFQLCYGAIERSLQQRYAIKFSIRLGRNVTETFQVRYKALGGMHFEILMRII